MCLYGPRQKMRNKTQILEAFLLARFHDLPGLSRIHGKKLDKEPHFLSHHGIPQPVQHQTQERSDGFSPSTGFLQGKAKVSREELWKIAMEPWGNEL